MCALCEIKTEEQLTLALSALENVWGDHEDAVRRDLRKYLIDIIEEYEDRHFVVPGIGFGSLVYCTYVNGASIGQMVRAALRWIGDRMWRALVPQQQHKDED